MTARTVSTRGESQWVKNVRANPVVILDTKVGAARFTAAELPVVTRAPVLRSVHAFRR